MCYCELIGQRKYYFCIYFLGFSQTSGCKCKTLFGSSFIKLVGQSRYSEDVTFISCDRHFSSFCRFVHSTINWIVGEIINRYNWKKVKSLNCLTDHVGIMLYDFRDHQVLMLMFVPICSQCGEYAGWDWRTFGRLRGCDWQSAAESQRGKIVCLAGSSQVSLSPFLSFL